MNPLALDNQLCFRLYAASKAVIRLYQPLLKALNLTYPQYLVMLVLWEEKSQVRLNDIGQRLHLDSGTLTPLLKRMAEQGLIRREKSRQDERALAISLTEAGRALEEDAARIPSQLMCQTQADMQDVTQLKTQLDTLLARLLPQA